MQRDRILFHATCVTVEHAIQPYYTFYCFAFTFRHWWCDRIL